MNDLIPVRADERFDSQRLSVWIDQHPELPSGPFDVKQFGGGKANLTYLLRFDSGDELVLRRPPLGPLAKSAHDMSREYLVLSRLWQGFDKAPRALAFSDDERIIGSQFFIMERKDGVVVRNTIPEHFGGGEDATIGRKLSEVVVDTLAEFHNVDAVICDLDDLGKPDGFLTRQVEGWTRRWERAKHEVNPLADEISGWLANNLPESPPPTLLHNDWRLDNMAVAPDDPGRCVAVYDWDMATRGDPLADLGSLMGSWFDPGEAPAELAIMPVAAAGWISRGEAVARYRERSGFNLEEIDWYLVFGSWKLAVILQQIYIRWLKGQTQDERFESMGRGARLLLELAAMRRS